MKSVPSEPTRETRIGKPRAGRKNSRNCGLRHGESTSACRERAIIPHSHLWEGRVGDCVSRVLSG